MGFGCGNHVGSPCTALKVMHTPRILMTTAMTAGANVYNAASMRHTSNTPS